MPLTSTYIPGGATGVNTTLRYSGGSFAGATVTHQGAGGQIFTFEFGGKSSVSGAPAATPVSPTFDPKIEANQLYGKNMALSAMGYARIGASPAPIVGPYLTGTTVDFVVSFGVPANVDGDRKIYKIYLDQELAWSSASGGTLPAHGTFAAEAFDFIFKPGRLDQTAVSLETEKFPGDECAYRPQMILQIRNLIFARFMEKTGKPVPYVACEIGDVTDAADPADGINLGDALERIAFSPWAGYSSSTFEAVGVTDVVDAILIKDNFTVVDLCRSVTREYRNIDLLVSDKTRVKDRGSSVSPNFVFNRNTIISDDEAVVIARAGATEQRREHELIAIDPDQDYTAVPSLSKIPRDPMVISAAVGKETLTVPLVIDASTRQALATFSQQYEENARRKVAFKVRAAGYTIEPGDLFALTDIADGIDNEVFKCTQTTHGANWVVEVEGEAILRCSIYALPAPSPGTVFVSIDTGSYERYAAVSMTTEQDWVGGYIPTAFTALGNIYAASYAKVADLPTFLVGGRFAFQGIMMASHDGIEWFSVFDEPTQYINDLVWNADEQKFFANALDNVSVPTCWVSPDGFNWTVHSVGTVPGPGEFWDHVPSGVSDGHAGYDAATDLRILPEDLDLDFMTVNCTAFADGIWMAGGALIVGGDSATATSIDGGVNWVLVTSGALPAGPGFDGGAANNPVELMVAAPAADMGTVS